MRGVEIGRDRQQLMAKFAEIIGAPGCLRDLAQIPPYPSIVEDPGRQRAGQSLERLEKPRL